jgi:predicted RNase H-like HicB family nuclease
MKYTVILEKEEEGGYSVQCLELPGAISQGETKEEALKNIEEAIEAVLEMLNQEIKWLSAAHNTVISEGCHVAEAFS